MTECGKLNYTRNSMLCLWNPHVDENLLLTLVLSHIIRDTPCYHTVVTRTRGSWVPSPSKATEAGERGFVV